MRNARFPPTSRYREFSQCGGECVHSALEESSTVTLDTWNILSRTVDHAYRLFTGAIAIVQLVAGSRYVVSLSRVAADKPIASAVDINAFGCDNYPARVHVRFIRND